MLDPLAAESIVETLLVAGITGAGLALATSTLAVTRAQPMLLQRARDWWTSILTLGKTVEQIKNKQEPYETLRVQSEKVRELASLPGFLAGLTLTFVAYCLLSIAAALWLMGSLTPWNVTVSQLLGGFVLCTILFLLTGYYAIRNVNYTLRREFERRKQGAAEDQK